MTSTEGGVRRGRDWDGDTTSVSSTAVTSPETEGAWRQVTSRAFGHGLETAGPARTFQADTPLSSK